MRVGKAPVQAIIECVKAVGELSFDKSVKVSTEKLLSHLKMSFEYVSDAVEGAIALQFIKKEKTLSLTSIGKKLSNSTTDDAREIFKNQMEKLPFIKQLQKLIGQGKNFDVAVREIVSKFDIQGDEKEIMYSFKNWIGFASILDKK